MTNNGYLIAIRVEADAFARHVVDYDGIEVLGCELLAGVFEDVLGLRGKADDNLRLLAERNLLQDIGSRLEVERHRSLALDFLGRGVLRAVIRNGSGFDDYC